MNDPSPIDIANWLDGQHRCRARFVPLPEQVKNNIAFAYEVQKVLTSLRMVSNGQGIGGWKVGLTTPRMQQMCNVHEPIAGSILAPLIQRSPAVFRKTDYVRLGIESELALHLRSAPPTEESASLDDLMACVGEVSAAFEIVEDRNADYTALSAASIIADNTWNAGLVFGPPISATDLKNLSGLSAVLTVNGKVSDRGNSDDIGGNPLYILGWLARLLASQGRPLAAGQWVSTGSIVPTKFPNAGDRYHFCVGDFPPVELTVE